jgi:uncharacterized repeat protein (TIGR01451 family)
VLTGQHGGQQVTIDAIGGFIYGADALNNPGSDLPIQGTGGTQGIVTPATGEVSASSSLVLATVTSSVVTPYGENESATGPDYVSHYQMTITAAPATVGNPITGTTLQIELPNNVEYNGGPITVTGSFGTATFTPGPAAPGGSVYVTIPSLSASDGKTVIDIPVYVPQFDASGAPILDPVTGAPVTIGSPTLVYDNGSWNPWSGSADHGDVYTLSGSDTTSATFTAKSLAMQETAYDTVTNSATQTGPNDEVQYTVNFQVSDYFSMGSLAVRAVLGDGLTVDPSAAPTLTLTPRVGSATTVSLGTISSATSATVNGEQVWISGSNGNWDFVNYNAPGNPGALSAGETQVNLQSAAALIARLSSANLSAGEIGMLTFDAVVLDKYTNTNIDPATSAPASITELDTVASTSVATATVLTMAGDPTATPSVSVSDGSQNTLTVPQGYGSVYVAALNGVAKGPNIAVSVTAGDEVTYALTRTLVTGDFSSLDLSAYLPLPVIDAADPASDGSSVASYALDTSEAGSVAFYPGLGKYSYFVAPSPIAPAPDYTVVSARTDATANSITFDLGNRDDTTNVGHASTPTLPQQYQTVTIYFTVKVSTAPFADGLDLTTQAGSTMTNGQGQVISTENIGQITVAEPNLVNSIKVGVVSLVNDSGTAKTGGFTIDGTSTSGDPTTYYAAAGTPVTGGGSLFLSGTGPSAIGDLQNLNVSGADGSDTVRIVETIANAGGGAGGAYDIVVSDLLPEGYTVSQVANLAVVRSGTLTQLVGQNGEPLTDLFTATGVTLEDPSSTATNPQPTLYAPGSFHRNVMTISFDLTLLPGQSAGSVLTDTGKILNYSNIYNGVALGNGFVVDGNPVGGSAAGLIDTATVTTTAPALTKTFGPSDISQNDNVDPSYPKATVVVGETRPITISVALPEGSIDPATGNTDVLVTELLPANESFVALTSITGSPGVSFTLPSNDYSQSGNTVTFDLGPQVLNTNADATGTVKILYTARFADGSNVNNTLFTSTANLIYSGSAVPSAQVTFIEHDPLLKATLTDNSGGTVYSNEVLTYTYTITNTGIVQSQATTATLGLPSGLTYDGGLRLVSQTNTPDSSTTVDASQGLSNGLLSVDPGTFDPSGTLVYTFKATVDPGLAAGTNLTVTSPQGALPNSNHGQSIVNAYARSYPFSASDPLFVANIVPTLYFAAEANGTAPVSPGDANDINMTIGDIARLHGVAQIAEGTNNNVVLDFTLPAGFVPYIADGTVTLALVSPNGAFLTTAPWADPAMQVTNASVADPASYAPGFVVPVSAIDTSVPGHLRIDLGTLTNDFGSALPNYAIVEFNGQVTNISTNTSAATLTDNFAVLANGAASNTVSRSETVLEPSVTLAKTVTAINGPAGTASYLITVSNIGPVTAYDVSLTDPLPAGNVNSVSGFDKSGGADNLVVTEGNGNVFAATMNLEPNATETFVYTLNVASATVPVPATTTSETWQDINPLVTGLTYNGLTSAIDATGSTTGSRDGSAMPNAGINNYWHQVVTSLGTASGDVWQALGYTPWVYDSSIDTPLGGVTVTILAAGGLSETVTTDPSGAFVAGLIPNGAFTVLMPNSGASGLPSNETLVFNVNGSGSLTPPASWTVTTPVLQETGINFVYEIPNTTPVLGNWATGKQTIAPGEPLNLSNTGATTAADTELDTLIGAHPATYSYGGAVLTVERYVGGVQSPHAADVFGGDSALTLSGNAVILSGQTVGSYTQSGGVLTLTFNATAIGTTVQEVLNHLSYSNATTGTATLNLTIGATLSDANFNSDVPLATGSTGLQGTGGVLTSAPVYSVFTLLPGATPYTVSYVEPNNTPEQGNAVTLPTTDLADLVAPGATLSQVVLTLGGGAVRAEDVLAFLAGSASGNIAGSFDAATGALTLTSAGATASLTQWGAALGQITYYDNSSQPHTTPRSVTYALTSATGGGTTTETYGTITVSATDDSPILDPTAVLALPHATEDALAPPSGATGALVSTLANSSNISDLDGANAQNGSAPGPAGLAVIAADTSVGNWWYSTNNGATWTEFAGSGMTAISATNALHLSADAATRIYFQPMMPDFNGAITRALTFRAWDQADGVANGTLSALPTDGPLGTGVNLQASAYSAATVSVNLIDDPVNDAPIAAGSTTLPAQPEDTTVPPHETVAALFAGNFSDTADQQQTPSNPTGSVANTLAGVAIIADPTPTSEGVWRYSTNGGATWTAISTSVSDGSALILPASALIDFLPVTNFNGAPLSLTERLIDSSTDVPITGSVTGLALQQGSAAYAGVDVSGAHNGGRTAVSAATVPLDEIVTPVNDAPIADGSAALPSILTTEQHPPGDTVANLYAPAFSDTADQQRTAINPTGSVANTLAGVVIVGNTTPAADGTWRYSTDRGATWVTIGTDVSDSNGLVLGTSAKLAFFPNAPFHGSPPPLQARLIDTSSDVPLTGSLTGAALAGSATAVAGVDVSGPGNGGKTAVSAAEVPLDTLVVALNNPIPKPPPFEPIERITGDAGMPPGWLVGSMVYRTIVAEQSGVIGVSADAFYGNSASEYLSYEATTASGGPLPPWMNFDPGTLTFSGVPPESAVGTLDLRVVARDREGRQAAAEVHVIIMRNVDATEDLMHALSQRRVAFPFLRAAPVHIPDGGRHKPAPTPPRVHAGRSGFSTQVREQAASGRLGRARAMLSGLTGPFL